MAAFTHRPRFGNWRILALLGALPAAFCAGCGSRGDGPVTAQNSGFEVAQDERGGADREPAAADPTGETAGGGGAPAKPAANPGGAAQAAGGPSAATQPKPGSVAASQIPTPPDMPPLAPEATKPPKASAELPETEQELLETLQQLQTRVPRQATPDLMLAELRQIQAERIAAAERLQAIASDQRGKVAAVQTKLDAMRRLSAMGSAEMVKQLNAYSRELQNGDDPELALLGRIARFGLALDDFAAGNQENAAAILAELKSLTQAEGINPGVFLVTSGAAQLLHQMGHREEAAAAYRAVGTAFQDSQDAELAAEAKWLLERADELDLDLKFDLGSKITQLIRGEQSVVPQLVTSVTGLLNEQDPGPVALNLACQAAQFLEMSDHAQPADQIFDLVEQRYREHADAELSKAALQRVENRRKRAALIGQPLTIANMQQADAAFDWQAYRGKVVLVVFWVSWSDPCLRELGNIAQNYRLYRDKGFEVVGISLDEDPATMQQFLDVQPLPWPTLFSAVPNPAGLQTPLAIECGVDALPFLVLVDRDGKVVSLHVTGPKLEDELERLLGPPASAAGEGSSSLPGSPASAPPGGAREAPPPFDPSSPAAPATGEPPAPSAEPAPPALPETIPAPGDSSSHRGTALGETFFVAWLQDAEAAEEAGAIDQDVNPYAPRPGLSPDELIDFIFSLQDKPKSIQERPGFAEGIERAADRVLAAEPKDKFCELAAEAKFTALHAAACRGDQQADQRLGAFAEQMRDHRLPKIAEQAAFYLLEQKTLQSDQLPLDKIPGLLDELVAYVADRPLDERHLRLASGTVHAINRLEDENLREEHFHRFGEMFAKSSSKDLARYGKKLAKPLATKPPELVGQALELSGVTALGAKLDWKSYRGKVVVVDFWATWCGPCRKAMPDLKALYDQQHASGFDVVGISLDRSAEELSKYLDENEIAWANVFGEDATQLAERYGVRGIPMMLVVDREGKVAAAGHQLEPLAAKVRELLEQKP